MVDVEVPSPAPVAPKPVVFHKLACASCGLKAKMIVDRDRKDVHVPPCPKCGNGSWIETVPAKEFTFAKIEVVPDGA